MTKPFNVQPIPYFATPRSVEELEEMIINFSNQEERAIATLAMGWTWNMFAKMIDDHYATTHHQNPYAEINPDD